MKGLKLLVMAAFAVLSVGSASYVMAACLADSGICWGSGQTTIENPVISGAATTYGLYSRTSAQIDALTPTAAGQLVFCSNCTRSAVCVSSGTGRGAFVILASTSTYPTVGTLGCE